MKTPLHLGSCNLGAEVVIGNAIDSAVLHRAGAARAQTLVAVTGDDEKNLCICKEVHTKMNPTCELSAGVESWSWKTYDLDRMKLEIRLDSYLSLASRSVILIVAEAAAEEAKVRNEGIRIILEISDGKRQEFLRATIMMLQISGDKKPLIELTCVGAGQEKAFRDRFPAVDLVADLVWHEDAASHVFPEVIPNDGQSPGLSLDFAIFALSTDIETLEAADRFWMRHETPCDRIYACLDATNIESLQRKDTDFSVISLLDHGLGRQHPLVPNIEQQAKICHTIYFRNEQAKNKSYGKNKGDLPESWMDLNERTKESNRLAAMHHQVKRKAWGSREPNSDMELLKHLARCEHMRWMAEKAMEGWRWSGSLQSSSRDNDKLKHNLLVPYNLLDNPEKDKDFNAFLWALDISDDDLNQLNLDENSKRMVQLARIITTADIGA